MLSIRPAREGDATVLAAIGLRAWANAASAIGITDVLRDNARASFENFSHSSWRCITLAQAADVVVGWAARENFDETITDFWVDPIYQRQGVGAVLLDEVERQIVVRGLPVAKLESHAQNDQAVSFFRKHGYRVSWLSMTYSTKLDREVQSVGLQKQLLDTEIDGYGFGF
ncbi:GNAT family N-acetyltransferase [Rhizobium skierniewicense]|uniref:GNAT family N-acetyltransferase n=1 Tax=Rhizobium skierniewicense TaxID=984260 RepID=UPI001574E5CF|nr:N-acetyltransferase [Rhizobium skierniewicense]NTF32051.1 GNAT family N-acetyltransferase [Rhizobium skierniewicense]